MEMLKLMMEDIIEADGPIGNEKYKVYPMEDLDCHLEYIKDEFNVENNFHPNFDKESKWFINDEVVVSMNDEEFNSFLVDNAEFLIELYSELETEHTMYNRVEVRAEILKDNLSEVDELESQSEEKEVIYQDVNIECIAEMLTEVDLRQLQENLGYYGTWEVNKVDEMIYLVDYIG